MQKYEVNMKYLVSATEKLYSLAQMSASSEYKCEGRIRAWSFFIYSLHLALTAEDLFSMICIYQKKAVSLNRSFRQTTNSQKVQTLASDILMMERGQSKNVTGILTLQYWNFFKILYRKALFL